MTVYLLDANVFIQAKNLHYGFDFCPAFWDWLVEQHRAGKVASIEKIADELHARKDKLATWAKERGDDFFLKPDDAVMSELHTVSDWANGRYKPDDFSEFLRGADCWLVAHALAHSYIVVTHEVPAGTIQKSKQKIKNKQKIKIPDACTGLDLRCMQPYEMLRRERARFVLGSGREAA